MITTVDIAGNLIETEGAQRLIKCLTESNDTLESLGDLTEYSLAVILATLLWESTTFND